MQCNFYCFGVKRSAIFTRRKCTAWAVANFMLYPAASQVAALPPRQPFLVAEQHLGLMCPTLLPPVGRGLIAGIQLASKL